MWKIPLYNLNFDEKELNAVTNVIESGWLTMGEMTKQFEEQFAKYMGVKHAIALSSGTAALHLAFLAIGLTKGDEVICPSLSFVASANSILYAGGTPVFSDIESLDNLNISPSEVENQISSKTKAIEVVHYGGYPCDMEPLLEIALKHNLYIIEDCAHALGASYNGKRCGTIGDIGCFSFFSNKNMTTAEGGMITTNNDEIYEKVLLLRSHGMTHSTLNRHKGKSFSYDVTELGFNYRMDEIRAGIGIVQLKKLKEYNKNRSHLREIYKKHLEGIQEIRLPFQPLPTTAYETSDHILPVILDKKIVRKDFMQWLKNKGIQTSIHYPPIHSFDFYKKSVVKEDLYLPNTVLAGNQEVTLPLYPSMSENDIYYVIDSIKAYINKNSEV